MAKITLTSFKELSDYVKATADIFATVAEKYTSLKNEDPQHWLLDLATLNEKDEFAPVESYLSYYGADKAGAEKYISDLEKAIKNHRADKMSEHLPVPLARKKHAI